jgi:hypothetical protein
MKDEEERRVGTCRSEAPRGRIFYESSKINAVIAK